MPCLPALLLRQKARAKYNIEGDTGMDVATSLCCSPCVTCQTAVEISEREDQGDQGDEDDSFKLYGLKEANKELTDQLTNQQTDQQTD